jgi:hypothetical protein
VDRSHVTRGLESAGCDWSVAGIVSVSSVKSPVPARDGRGCRGE